MNGWNLQRLGLRRAVALALLVFALRAPTGHCADGVENFMGIENVTKKVLSNGMTALIREDRSAPVATVNVWVKTGYFNEPDKLTGISHMLEHMFFKGTPSRPVGKIQEEVKNLGGYWNAGTIYDHTNYYIVVPSSEIGAAMEIEADALMNSTFDAAELDKEHEVVIQEILRKYDRPDAMTWEKMIALMYTKHHMGRWRMGTPEQIRAMSRDVMIEYYTNTYRPENIILAVVGDVDAEKVAAEAERLFGAMPRGKLKRPVSPPEPPQSGLRYGQAAADISQAYLTIGFPAPPATDPDEHAADVLSYLLGNGKSARLFRELKERRRLVNSISAGYYAMEGIGTFYIEAELETRNIREAVDAIFVELERVKRDPPTAAEMARIKSTLEYEFLASLEDVGGQSNRLAWFESLGDYRLLADYVEKMRAVTAEDARAAAEKFLLLDKCSIQEYRPTGEEDATTAESMAGAIRAATASAKYEPDQSATDAIVSAPAAPGKADRPVTLRRLSNGIEVILRERPRLPLVSLGVYFEGGRPWDVPDTAGLTRLAMQVSLKGTKTRDAERIQDELALLGAAIGAAAGPDYSSWKLSGLSRSLPASLDILADVILNSTFPPEEIEKERETQLADIRRGQDNMYYYPMELARGAAWGNHPYGLPANGYENSVAAITRDDVTGRIEGLVKSNGTLITAVGDFDTDTLLGLLEEKFGSLAEKPAQTAPPPVFSVGEKTVARRKSQSAQAFAFPAVPAGADNTPALNILRNIASGMGGRLYDEVREKNNLAYTVAANLEMNKFGGMIVNYAATLPENEQKAREMILAEWRKMAVGGITRDEFDVAVSYTAGIHQISLQTNADLRDLFAFNHLMGRGLDYVDRFSEMIRSAKFEDVLSAAAAFGAPAGYALGVVRAEEEEQP